MGMEENWLEGCHTSLPLRRGQSQLFILGQGWGLWLPPTSTSPASLHTWPGEGAYRGKGEYREDPSVPWQLASAWTGSCSAPCTHVVSSCWLGGLL